MAMFVAFQLTVSLVRRIRGGNFDSKVTRILQAVVVDLVDHWGEFLRTLPMLT